MEKVTVKPEKVIVAPRDEGLIVRKPNRTPYKTGEEVILNTSVARDLRSGDLMLYKEKQKNKKG